MKITMTKKELEAMKNVCTQLDDSTKESFEDLLNQVDYGIVSVNPFKHEVTIEINPDYIVEAYDTFGVYVPVFVAQAKVMIETCKTMMTRMAKVAEKYLKLPEKEEVKEAEETPTTETDIKEEPVGEMNRTETVRA